MKKNLIAIILIVAALGLGVFSWFVLPDVVVVQIGNNGEATNTMPKLFAVLIPIGMTAVGSAMNISGKGDMNKKGLIVSAIGIAVAVLTLLLNL
ncbi:MAG: DUF1648 domain-containing protein [Eubacteriales bacterium]